MNPIEERLEKLLIQWATFAENPQARILRWVVASDEVSMVDAFWQREADDQAAQTNDLLFRLDVPFGQPERHGLELRQELKEQYAAAQEALEEERKREQSAGGEPEETPVAEAAGVVISPELGWKWQCPGTSGSDDVDAWVVALEALRVAHAPEGAVLGIWLSPKEVSDPEAYLSWLRRLAQSAPSGCRFVVLDDADQPAFAALAEVEPERVSSVVAGLDMVAAVAEVLKKAGEPTTPGAKLRNQLIDVGNAAKAQDLGRATTLADEVVALAAGQSWFALAAVPHIVLAGALSGAGRHEDAVARYQAAEESAVQAEAASDPQGPQLRLQARMMRGSALIAQGAFASAAPLFEEAAPWAVDLKDPRATLDCWRLASYCLEQSGQVNPAWDAGLKGFEVGRAMDAKTRETSTLPYLAEGLMRLAEQPSLLDLGPDMERQIVELLGPDWRPSEAASQASQPQNARA